MTYGGEGRRFIFSLDDRLLLLFLLIHQDLLEPIELRLKDLIVHL